MNIFKQLFNNKKTELEKEEEIEREVIDNNISLQNKTNICIIKYKVKEDNDIPDIIHICDFHVDTLPNNDSIIWCPNETQTNLIPYKVIRYDFIEDPEQEINSKIYIVVTDAKLSDITNENIY